MLKEKAAYARKGTEEAVLFEYVKPESYFKANREDLKKTGFRKSKTNPLYDHLSKLLYAKNILSMAGFERIISSPELPNLQLD